MTSGQFGGLGNLDRLLSTTSFSHTFQNMLNKIAFALTATVGGGFLLLTTALTPSAMAQADMDYRQAMAADGFTLWNSGESQNIAFNVWKRPARAGGGFYYFMWEGQYASVADRGNPEVVVFFDSNLAQLNSDFLVDCYHAGSGSICLNSQNKPAHYRYTGACIFPWQYTSTENICGSRAAIASPGDF